MIMPARTKCVAYCFPCTKKLHEKLAPDAIRNGNKSMLSVLRIVLAARVVFMFDRITHNIQVIEACKFINNLCLDNIQHRFTRPG